MDRKEQRLKRKNGHERRTVKENDARIEEHIRMSNQIKIIQTKNGITSMTEMIKLTNQFQKSDETLVLVTGYAVSFIVNNKKVIHIFVDNFVGNIVVNAVDDLWIINGIVSCLFLFNDKAKTSKAHLEKENVFKFCRGAEKLRSLVDRNCPRSPSEMYIRGQFLCDVVRNLIKLDLFKILFLVQP